MISTSDKPALNFHILPNSLYIIIKLGAVYRKKQHNIITCTMKSHYGMGLAFITWRKIIFALFAINKSTFTISAKHTCTNKLNTCLCKRFHCASYYIACKLNIFLGVISHRWLYTKVEQYKYLSTSDKPALNFHILPNSFL
jgi:hypothetical protein